MTDLNSDEISKVNKWCEEAPNDYGALECKLEVVNSLYWGGENDFEAAVKYCSEIDEPDRELCFNHFYNLVSFFYHTPDLNRSICQAVPPKHKSSCEIILLR